MTIMITGGAGFVGLNIAEFLLGQGKPVVSFGLEAPPAAAMKHFRGLPGTMAVQIGDVRDRGALLDTMRRHDVKQLVHGAAVTAGLAREARQSALIAAVNLGGTIEALEAAIENGVARVVQLGTGSVFGASVKKDGWLDENQDTPVPDSLYGITKYAAERVGLRYRHTRGLDLVVARLGVVFGRWEYDTGLRDTLSIPLNLMRLAEQKGHAAFCDRLPDDWIYASDVARAIALLLDAPSLVQSVYHVATGQRWSAGRWCERLRLAYPGFSYEIVESAQAANIGTLAPSTRPPFSIARLKADLGFEPLYAESEAFSDYMKWRREKNPRSAA